MSLLIRYPLVETTPGGYNNAGLSSRCSRSAATPVTQNLSPQQQPRSAQLAPRSLSQPIPAPVFASPRPFFHLGARVGNPTPVFCTCTAVLWNKPAKQKMRCTRTHVLVVAHKQEIRPQVIKYGHTISKYEWTISKYEWVISKYACK